MRVRPDLLALFALGTVAPLSGQPPEFQPDVRPLLSDRCFFCHGPDPAQRKAGLRLDRPESALAARKNGAPIVPGKPERSLLIARITHPDPKKRMPPASAHKTLAPEEIDLLRAWIAAGANYEEHWSYVPPRRYPLPAVEDCNWCRNFIDRWLLARLEREGLTPSPQAEATTLLRRAYFDLTGLPPTPQEVDAFCTDASPDRFERVVDRLLASPRYGERMAAYWLDLVRYADTVGYHGDQEHPIALYRNWVIRAFHENMPFDRFTIEQLAGDLLANPTIGQKIATGYNRVLQTTHEGGAQAKEYLAIYAADRLRNFGSVWLGATTGCAQCHDHKYDPFTTRDFYSLAAFFADIEEKGDFKGSPDRTPTTRPPELVLLAKADEKKLAALDARIAKLPEKDGRRKKLRERRKKVLARGRRTMITKHREPRTVRVLPRGNWLDESGEIVVPATPAFLPAMPATSRRATRLDLARWLFREGHPLTARVFVNRLWYLFFGKGIARSLDDLGAQGEPPVHPELLDALALEFVASGWDVKHMVRLLVTSSAYRQSSQPRAELAARDPANRLVARQSRWRLPAEMIRDNALAISGLLVQKVGGGPIKPYQPAGYYRHLNFPKRRYHTHTDERQWRRGVYMHWQRQFLHPALLAFDAPTREECCAERPTSNTPQASLTLLNDPTFVEAARALATRLLRECATDDARFARGFRLATSRRSEQCELAPLRRLLAKHRREYGEDPAAARELLAIGLVPVAAELEPAELAAWMSVTRVLLNLSETITRD